MIAWITIKYTWKRKIIIPNASMSLKFIDLLWPILFASYKSCDRNANTISIKKERKFILILMIAWIFIKSKKYTYQMLQVHQFTLIWDKIYITGTFRIRFWWLYKKHINREKITEISMIVWMTMNYSWKQINVDPILSIKIYYICLRCCELLGYLFNCIVSYFLWVMTCSLLGTIL